MDDSYRSLLPLIRLRSENPDWFVPFVLVSLVLMLVLPLVHFFVYRYRARKQLWSTFRDNALECGLDEAQIQFLERVAFSERMRHPLILLSSHNAFDRYTGRHIKEADPGEIARMRDLLHFGHPLTDHPLHSTHQLALGQPLLVWPVKGGPQGFVQCVLVDRDEHALYAAPLLRESDRHLSGLEAEDRVKVRFWREGDTEYRFRTRILKTPADTTTIAIKHTDEMERIQKRDFFRLDVRFDLTLHLAADETASKEPQTVDGTVTNISGGGLSLLTATPVALGSLLEIDSGFAGAFPLAGIHCQTVSADDTRKGWHLRVEFVDLPSQTESAIVRQIYKLQLKRIAI